jgi:hypothetical protein
LLRGNGGVSSYFAATTTGPKALAPLRLSQAELRLHAHVGTTRKWTDAQNAWSDGKLNEWPRYKNKHSLGYFTEERPAWSKTLFIVRRERWLLRSAAANSCTDPLLQTAAVLHSSFNDRQWTVNEVPSANAASAGCEYRRNWAVAGRSSAPAAQSGRLRDQ